MIEALTLQVLRHARRILEDGGDPAPCELGPFCVRCCLAIAKTDVDVRFNAGAPLTEVLRQAIDGRDAELVGDAHLVDARKLIAAYDKGIAHADRYAAMAVIDRAIAENA